MCNVAKRITDTVSDLLPKLPGLINSGHSLAQISLADDLGEDSLERCELTMALEEEFETNITDEASGNWVTVQDIVDYINTNQEIHA